MLRIFNRFWDKTTRTDDTEKCWEWTGAISQYGYGTFTMYNVSYLAHRVAYTIWYAEDIPDGMFVLHSCDNRKCVNPHHLRLGTAKDNAQDRVARTPCKSRRRLSEQQAGEIKYLGQNKIHSQYKLAEMYNTHRTHIGNIVNNHKWKHVEPIPC